jgi:hypothetical protein
VLQRRRVALRQRVFSRLPQQAQEQQFRRRVADAEVDQMGLMVD